MSITAAKFQNFVYTLDSQKLTWTELLEFDFFNLKKQGYGYYQSQETKR